MQIDPARQSHAENYKLLTNLVIPRPIAWVTTLSPGGLVNLAPFSFFNAVSSDPMYVVLGIGRGVGETPKDTLRNVLDQRELVVNLVTEDLLGAMNTSAADFPPDQSELVAAGLHTAPSVHVKAPRVAESPVSLECRLYKTEPLGSSTLVIAEVVMFHVADPLIGPRSHINGFAPLGRLGSPSAYCRTTDRLELPRITFAEWSKSQRR